MDIKPEDDNQYFRVVDTRNQYSLSLTVKELVYVDDSISLLVNREDQVQSIPLRMSMPANTIGAPMELIQKVGMAMLGVFDAGGPVVLTVTELELMILRELAHSSIRAEEHLIGLGLKRKVYEALWGDKLRENEVREKVHKDLLSTLDEIVSKDPSASEFLDGVVEKEE